MKDFLKIWISEKRDIFLVPLEVTENFSWFICLYFCIYASIFDIFSIRFDIISLFY